MLIGQWKLYTIAFCALVLSVGCGTSVGNPKQPADDEPQASPTPPPDELNLLSIPEIDFQVPADVVSDESAEANLALTDHSMHLTNSQDVGSEGSVFLGYVRRLDRNLRNVNKLTRHINNLLSKGEYDNAERVIKFRRQGLNQGMSGRVGPYAGSEDYQFAALICQEKRPILHFKWSEDGHKMEVLRDFAVASEDGEVAVDFKSMFRVDKTTTFDMTIANQGTLPVSQVDGADGPSISEMASAQRFSDGRIHLRTVFDRYEGAPEDEDYEADSYLTGRILPLNANGRRPSEFVAYYKGARALCHRGFDETRDDLWSPKPDGPRWCLGRPLGRRRFTSPLEFFQTVARLEEVGILSRDQIKTVAFDDGLVCE